MSARRSLALGAVLASCAGGPAAAQICTVSVTAMAFGSYNTARTTGTDSTGTITVGCQATLAIGISYTIAIGAGGGTIAARRLALLSNTLAYQLYTDSARTLIWGDGSSGSRTVADSVALVALGSSNRSYTVYGRIAARQAPAPGVYLDTVTVQITY